MDELRVVHQGPGPSGVSLFRGVLVVAVARLLSHLVVVIVLHLVLPIVVAMVVGVSPLLRVEATENEVEPRMPAEAGRLLAPPWRHSVQGHSGPFVTLSAQG